MTETKEQARPVEAVEQSLEELQKRLAEMRGELAELSRAPELSWDASHEEWSKLEEAETKRLVLTHRIRAGELREKELELELAQARLPEVEAETLEVHDIREKKRVKRDKAQEEYDAADQALVDAQRTARDLKADIHRLTKEVASLKSKAFRDQVALNAPVVRSLWHSDTRRS